MTTIIKKWDGENSAMIFNLFWFIYFISIFTMDISSIFDSQLGNIALFLSIIYLVYKSIIVKKGFSINTKFLFLILFLMILSLFTLLINQNLQSIYILRVIKLNSFILFYLVGYNIYKEQKSVFRIFQVAYLVFVSVLFIQNLEIINSLIIQRRILTMDFAFFEIYTGNLFAVALVFIQWINLSLLPDVSYRFNNIVKWLSFVLSVPVIIVIYSRTAFVVGFFLIIYYIVKNYKKYKGGYKALYIVGTGCMIVIFINLLSGSSIADRLMYTFSAGSMGGSLDNSTYSRFLIAKNLIEYFSSNALFFFFGTGFEEYDSLIGNSGYYFTSAHNGFLNIWFKAGVLYLGGILSLILYPISNYKKIVSPYLNEFRIGILVFFLSNLTAEAFSYFMYYQLFFLMLGITVRDNREKKIMRLKTISSEKFH